MCGQHNARASAGDNTGQNTKDTPNRRTEIKIRGPAGNRTRAAGFEGRDSTDHTTATDKLYLTNVKIVLMVCTFSQELFIVKD